MFLRQRGVAAPEDFPRSSSYTFVTCHEDILPDVHTSILLVDFSHGVSAGTHSDAKFFEGVRRNQFSAKLVVRLFASPEDVLSDVHISIMPVNWLLGFARPAL